MNLETKLTGDVFITSDTHYGHANICRGVSTWDDKTKCRDFDTVEQMNDAIVANINKMVGVDDILIHLGDFSFGGIQNIFEFRERINCRNIYLIIGNHDKHIEVDKNGDFNKLFVSIKESMLIKYNGFYFFCAHLPILSWPNMDRGVIHLHGHLHLSYDEKIHTSRAMDVGMDGNNMHPYHLTTTSSLLRHNRIGNLNFKNDHHL